MSFQYDQYLARHRANVKRGFDWLSENLPGLMTNTLTAGWILIHDDMENGELETVLEMPYDYIIEMICDWWSFSWQSGNLYEIFKWYEEHSKYIKLAQTTKITVEYILDNMKKKLQALQYADQSAMQPGA